MHDYENDMWDEDLKPCVDVWRSLHATEYNQFDPEPWGANEYAPHDDFVDNDDAYDW